jgi:predicted nucleic acid-binding protein
MGELLRVFLDANILFSAGLKETSRLRKFWELRNLALMTSMYVADEARRNCVSPAHGHRLEELLAQTHIVSDATGTMLPRPVELPAKDAPVLAAAIQAGADYLITGDRHHFGRWMNLAIATSWGHLVIQEPGQFLDEHLDPLDG